MMPVKTIITLCTVRAGYLLKYAVDYLIRAQIFTRRAVSENESFRNTLLPSCDVVRIIDHPVRKYLQRNMSLAGGGFYIFGGPPSVGKSTMLSCAIDHFRSKDSSRRVPLFTTKSTLIGRGIHKELGIPDHQRVSDYCTPGAVFVVDQLDINSSELTPEIESYIKELAVDSVNSSKFKVILVVSDPVVMRRILLLNDREKIEDIMDPSFLKWTYAQIDLYIERLPSKKLKRTAASNCRPGRNLKKSCKEYS